MTRNTPTEVASFYQLPPSVDVEVLRVFIEAADLLITEELATSGLSEARLKLIEVYIASHFAVQSFESGGHSLVRTGEGEERYRTIDQKALGLSSSRYGQQAIMLDTTGRLGAISTSAMKAEFRVVSPSPTGTSLSLED